MRFVFTNDVAEFAERTRALFGDRIECNIHATVLQHALEGRYTAGTPVFAYGVGEQDEVSFAALRTPPWFMLPTELETGSAPEFVRHWLEADPDVPGVDGLPDTARAIAAAWREQTGLASRCRMRQRMHVLDEVRAIRSAPGRLRRPHDHERQLLIEWMEGFIHDADILAAGQAEAMVDGSLARDALMVWDDGEPVSMVSSSPEVSGVVRIGPVYTPPEHRRRGYATNMVGAASRRALAGGAKRCMLYTDLANPTSNKIYADVGYRQAGDWEEHAFERG